MRIIALVLFLNVVNVCAQWQQKGNDVQGVSADDLFGVNVASNAAGTSFIAGALGNDTGGSNAGHARVYEWTGTNWAQKGSSLVGEAAGDNFGISVSMNLSGEVVAVGGYANDGNGTDAGHVRVFLWDGNDWSQMGADIEGQLAGDFSGLSIALSADGSTIIIGDYYNDNTAFVAGSARVFDWNGSSWLLRGSPINGDAFGDNFGFSVDISFGGDTIAVGAVSNDAAASNAGQVKVLSWSGSSWNLVGNAILGTVADDKLGHDVSLNADGSSVAIGVPGDDSNGSGAGAAFIYDWSGTAWVLRGTAVLGEAASNEFGHSLDITPDGNKLVVGAHLNDEQGTDAGHFRIFEWTGSTWQQISNDFDGDSAGDWMGKSVAIDTAGITVVAGAPQHDLAANNAGIVQAYQLCPALNTSITQSGLTLSASNGFDAYQWVDCDNNYNHITNETNSSYTATSNGNYAIILNQDGCVDTSGCQLIEGVGLSTFTNEGYMVYPNPAVDVVTVKNIQPNSTIKIFDLQGKLIGEFLTTGTYLDIQIQSYEAGTYIIYQGAELIGSFVTE